MGATFSLTNFIQTGVESYRCTSDSPDELLLEGCRRQDRLAQKYLYQRYYGRMLGICMRYAGSRDEAIEMLNSAFFKVFKSVDSYKGSGALAGWIAKVVLHTSIDWARAQSTYRKKMDFSVEKENATLNDALQNLAVEEIFEKVQLLPVATRTVFSLYVLEGYTHKEIAEELNISSGTSKWHLAEARKKLQTLLSGSEKLTHGKAK
jgi:RNA polymerase sigma factor (sigma-70 family)